MNATEELVPPDFVQIAYHTELPADAATALDLLFALRRCLQRVNADLYRSMGSDAVSPGRMQMLMVLWASRQPMRQADAIALLNISRPSGSELMEALERDGFIKRTQDARHSLRFMVSLTRKGSAFAKRLLRDNTERLKVTLSDLAIEEQRLLVTSLDRIAPI